MTNTHAAVAARGAASSPPAVDDAFATLLEQSAQDAGNDDAKGAPSDKTAAKNSPSADAKAQPADDAKTAPSDKTADKNSPPADAVDADVSIDRAATDPSDTGVMMQAAATMPTTAAATPAMPDGSTKLFDGAGRTSKATPTPRAHDPLAHPARTVSDDKPAQGTADPAQVPAGPVIANPAVQPPASSDLCSTTAVTASDPAVSATAAVVTPNAPAAIDDGDAAATDITAASMQSSGAVAKPAKPGEAQKPQSDSAKSQARQAMAAALTDAGAAVSRSFADQKIVSALPLHTSADAAKPGDKAAAAPSDPGAPAASTSPHAAPDAAPTPTTAAATAPVHAQAAPQTTPAITTAISNTAPLAGSAATKVSAQLQIGHPAQPDVAALAVTIASKSEGGTKHFDIRLDPAELGRVDVHLTVDDAGKTQATLSVEKPQTLDMLQKDQPQLERALKEAGLDLTQNGLNFSLKGQQQQAGGNDASPSRGRTLTARAVAAVDNTASAIPLGQMSPGDTRLDIRV